MATITNNGGGATHIAKVTGQLKDLSSNLSDILIVSGGGGGGLLVGDTDYSGKEAGGISGSGDNSADQSTGNAFGQGENGMNVSGGGSGLYGGYKGTSSKSGGAGSGYIGNSLLSNKKMVGFNVPTSDTESTKTESVNVYSASGEADKPKSGNGKAKIKLITLADLLSIKAHTNFISKLPDDYSETDITDLDASQIQYLFTNTDILTGQKNAKPFIYDSNEDAIIFDATESNFTASRWDIYLGGLYRFLKATFKYKKPIVYDPNVINMTYFDVKKIVVSGNTIIKENINNFFNSDNQIHSGVISDYVEVVRDYSNDSRYISNYRNYFDIVAFNGKVYIKDLVIEAIKIE